ERLQPEVRAAALDLVLEIPGRQAVAAARDLGPGSDSALNEGLEDVAARIARVLGVVRQVSALRRDEDLVAGHAALPDAPGERPAARPLAPQPAVGDRRIEHVDPTDERRRDGLRVPPVG